MNKTIIILLSSILVLFSACSTRGRNTYIHDNTKTYSQTRYSHNSVSDKKIYSHPTMRPYVVRGVRYHPTVVSVGDIFKGNASWYGPDFHGKLTSNGERYNMYAMTAAHKTLPMNTILRVTNRRNGRSVVVRVNDRGPFVATRIIDLSKAAANQLNMIGTGTAPVLLEVIGFEGKGGVRVASLNRKKPKQKQISSPVVLQQQEQINDFALQIASFANIDGAIKTQEKYDNTDGYKTVIKDMQTQNGRMFKVFLKGFRSEQEARDYKVSGPFSGAFIVREN